MFTPLHIHTLKCPCCSMSTISTDPNIDVVNVKAHSIFGNRGKIEIPLFCRTCGWKGNEMWECYYLSLETTFAPPKAIKPAVPMFDVESNAISSIGYDRAARVLYIQFRSSNKIYGYTDVEMAVFIDFLNTDRKGRYYADYIHGQYVRL